MKECLPKIDFPKTDGDTSFQHFFIPISFISFISHSFHLTKIYYASS